MFSYVFLISINGITLHIKLEKKMYYQNNENGDSERKKIINTFIELYI